MAERFIRGAMLVGAAVFIVSGAWALIDPASFYDELALFPPYNRHFLHDAGAFQLGLGAALVLAFLAWDGRRVVLWAVAFGAALHAVSHFLDTELGGRDSDPWLLSLLAALLIAAAVLATRQPEQPSDATTSPTVGVSAGPPARAPQQGDN